MLFVCRFPMYVSCLELCTLLSMQSIEATVYNNVGCRLSYTDDSCPAVYLDMIDCPVQYIYIRDLDTASQVNMVCWLQEMICHIPTRWG
jgi:hypothetical protein